LQGSVVAVNGGLLAELIDVFVIAGLDPANPSFREALLKIDGCPVQVRA
jgi:hypothetical protein